jgi:hypothetical protein
MAAQLEACGLDLGGAYRTTSGERVDPLEMPSFKLQAVLNDTN